MKKSFIIIILTLIQCACASSPQSPATGVSMLSFDAIGAAITVDYEDLETWDEPLQAIAKSH